MIRLCTPPPGRSTQLTDASLTLNLANWQHLSKWEFGKVTVTYLRRQVSQDQVHLSHHKVSAISHMRVPHSFHQKSLSQVHRHGRSFSCNFSTVIHSAQSKCDFVSVECQHAFENMTSLLSHAPDLAAPDSSSWTVGANWDCQIANVPLVIFRLSRLFKNRRSRVAVLAFLKYGHIGFTSIFLTCSS